MFNFFRTSLFEELLTFLFNDLKWNFNSPYEKIKIGFKIFVMRK